jgi:hypothetical protein
VRLLHIPALRPCRSQIMVLSAVMALAGLPAHAQKPDEAAQHPPPAPTAAQETMHQGEATGTLGHVVIGPDEKAVGRIVEVLVNDTGQPRAAVLDVGGFLGLGNRQVAVAWRALHFTPTPDGSGTIILDMTAEQIKVTPEYRTADKPVTVAAPPQNRQAHP